MNEAPARGFTIIELLVVIVIITILVSAVLVVSTTVIEKGRINNTKAVLRVVADALEEFQREQQDHRTITRRKAYRDRYGGYPPDELEVFTPGGIPNDPNPQSLAVGGAEISPTAAGNAGWDQMRFYSNGDPVKDSLEHRDLAAMIVAIETLSEKAALILGRLPKRNRTAGPLDTTKAPPEPSLFLDRNENQQWDPLEDFQIRYIVDDWGVPLSYLAQRDWDPNDSPSVQQQKASSNHTSWNEASSEIIKINRGLPLIFSYGPNGKDQLDQEWMATADGTGGAASLVGDFEQATVHGRIDHQLNADNVYLDPNLTDRLAKGIEEE